MVLPKDGFYHPNSNYEITEEYSTVCLEILNSPACRFKTSILNLGDIVSTLGSICGVGLGIASLLTPIGPFVIGKLYKIIFYI